jgi:hypothetical protein
MHNFAGCDGHICAVERLRQEDHEFETGLAYINAKKKMLHYFCASFRSNGGKIEWTDSQT